MTTAPVPAGPAGQGAAVIAEAFDRYHREFLEVTRRARRRFERRDWLLAQADSRARLALYPEALVAVLAAIEHTLGPRLREAPLWALMRAAHAHGVRDHPAGELAETFFNSVTRRVFRTVGTNPDIEYLDFTLDRASTAPASAPVRRPAAGDDLAGAVDAQLDALDFDAAWADRRADAAAVADMIARAWADSGAPHRIEALELLEPVFYRRKGAYLVGRVLGGSRTMPLVLPLVHPPDGIRVDATLCREAELSIVFSFTRSYFLADVARPSAVISFLRTLMPLKPVAELYTALGHHKHGKTEFYRDLYRHLANSDDRFARTPGARGLVMEVFALPGFDAVFKVIKDDFPPPKTTTPAEVRRRYAMVFEHDRAGRLVDAQAFEGLAFPRARFAPALLADLLASCARTVRLDGDVVTIGHLYAERRLRPLDVFMATADATAARAAALDYGQAIRDLAATGVFPGDVLIKNFGVTRHGRVVFYDYDELRLLEECQFRDLPAPRTPEDELMAEPWYYVGPDDVFPEELAAFVPFAGAVAGAFLEAHGDLYHAAYWRDLQARVAAGEVVDIYPYAEQRRLSGSTRHQ